MKTISQRIAEELAVRTAQVDATVQLLDEGATVPFIARYRKEVTGSLDDTQLRTLAERLGYLRELEERRSAILTSIAEQGKLSPALEESVRGAATKTELEDLYLPYKPKRRTRAQIAREAGLEPLATLLWDAPETEPEAAAAGYVNAAAGVADVKAALDGARQILIERIAEDAALVGRLRERTWSQGALQSRAATKLAPELQAEAARFADYAAYDEPIHRVPSHRALALLRGRALGVLDVTLEPEPARAEGAPSECEALVASHFGLRNRQRAADKWLADTVRLAWRGR